MLTAWHWQKLTAAGLVALGLSAIFPACSVAFDLSADQCSSHADCDDIGGGLSICQAGICVADSAGTGGTATTGGSTAGGEASDGGDAGAPSPTECTKNNDCIEANFGEPFVCHAGQCIALETEECPLVIGAENLRAEEPIIFGAYALAPDGVSPSVVSRNLELAVSEFTAKVIGLRGGAGGTPRTLAFVVCNSYFPDVAPGTIDAFLPSLEHLIDTLHVPGIVSALGAKDLQAVFAQKLNAAGTFVISPYEQDSELAALSDSGRLWHMLGATSDLAPAFGPLLKRAEAYQRLDDTFLVPEPDNKLRVAIVAANIARETDVRDALLGLPELEDFAFRPYQVESALLTSNPDVSGVTGDLLEYKPHIIVALAGSEFIEGVFPGLENVGAWKGQVRPIYLLGSAMGPETWSRYSTKQGDGGGWSTFFDRVLGVAYASAEDPALLRDYEQRLIAASGDLLDPALALGSENVYDAAYLMIYAAAAAGEVPSLGGKELATGMRRLIEGTAYNIGPAPISNVLTALDNGQDIGLNLTLGEPDWNAARGTRRGQGSIYCLNNGSSSVELGFDRGPQRDVLRFDPETNSLDADPIPCIPNF